MLRSISAHLRATSPHTADWGAHTADCADERDEGLELRTGRPLSVRLTTSTRVSVRLTDTHTRGARTHTHTHISMLDPQVGDLMMGCAFVNSKRGEEAADDAQARATVAAAIAAGIRDFDTA